MTFSIAARCPATGRLGVAISSSSPAVAARCPYARAGIGAVSTQNITDPRLGPRMLDLLALGASAADAIEILRRTVPHIQYRQLIAIDAAGGIASFSGEHTLGIHAVAKGEGAIAAGNLLANTGIPEAMIAGFAADAPLPTRLIAALAAGLAAGGESGPVHSAGLLVVGTESWPLVDLRVDWHDSDPISALAALWARYEPEMDPYITRALEPGAAPSYGVPGDP